MEKVSKFELETILGMAKHISDLLIDKSQAYQIAATMFFAADNYDLEESQVLASRTIKVINNILKENNNSWPDKDDPYWSTTQFWSLIGDKK